VPPLPQLLKKQVTWQMTRTSGYTHLQSPTFSATATLSVKLPPRKRAKKATTEKAVNHLTKDPTNDPTSPILTDINKEMWTTEATTTFSPHQKTQNLPLALPHLLTPMKTFWPPAPITQAIIQTPTLLHNNKTTLPLAIIPLLQPAHPMNPILQAPHQVQLTLTIPLLPASSLSQLSPNPPPQKNQIPILRQTNPWQQLLQRNCNSLQAQIFPDCQLPYQFTILKAPDIQIKVLNMSQGYNRTLTWKNYQDVWTALSILSSSVLSSIPWLTWNLISQIFTSNNLIAHMPHGSRPLVTCVSPFFSYDPRKCLTDLLVHVISAQNYFKPSDNK
jgi:hypothetical protein